MKGSTHATLALATVSPFININEPKNAIMIAGVGLIAGYLADIDHPNSKISKKTHFRTITFMLIGFILFTVFNVLSGKLNYSSLLNMVSVVKSLNIYVFLFFMVLVILQFLPHRTLSHSLLGFAVLSFCFYNVFPNYNLYFVLGYASHLFADFLTTRGTPLFYPISDKHYSLNLCSTSSALDYVIGFLGFLISSAVIFRPLINSVI